MSRTDLIADSLTIIRNAIMAKKENVDLPASKQVKSILEILKDQGYIDNFKLIEDKKQGYLRVYLKYTLGKSAIRNIERVSKPGLRKYVGSKEIPDVLRGRGISIVSTSKGITTGDEARKMNLGGEILCFVW
ncbi:MAG: 30S ribosomal protein S8 [Candidatus Omnitrophica bacterium]|nr:30S ribosomal protein S8 [Candidatus Omnitrophota bacterium]MDD5553292.1 30S ribosomal protein S8 [Candidatus Omnitrophota bacterium]